MADQRVRCPEDPIKLCGQPIGQYHCPECGCMQVACSPHWCDPDSCLLENCECLPEGVSKSSNLLAWEARSNNGPDDHEERCYLAGYGESW
jgi:hypothetical protein